MLSAAILLSATLACSAGGLPAVQEPAVQATTENTAVSTTSGGNAILPTTAPSQNDDTNGTTGSAPPADIGDIQQTLETIYQQVNPGVVAIEISAQDTQQGSNGELVDIGSGSGFVIDTDGHIVTNNHVVEQSSALRAVFSDGTVLDAKVVGADQFSDLAVIQVTPPDGYELHPVPLGDSDNLKVGQIVIAIGSPFGLSNSMSMGIISAIGRTLPGTGDVGSIYSNPQIIQTDAAINPGNSGGPLLDVNGQVIGVNAAIRSTSGANSGISFAIPVNTVKHVVPQLIEKGSVDYPYLGIEAVPISLAEIAGEFNLPVDEGVLIAAVVPGGPADQAGLQGGTQQENFRGNPVVLGGDIITAINGNPIKNFDELIGWLTANSSPGDQVTLSIVRNGQTMDVPLTLGSRPSQ
jgi:2-alkenal reductase